MTIEEKINDLIENKIGVKYEMFFEDGNYKGCFMPIYEIYQNLPRFPLPDNNIKANFGYGLSKIENNAQKIDQEDLQIGDIVAAEFREELHVALYIGRGQIVHVFRGHDLRINKMDILRNIKGFYRFNL